MLTALLIVVCLNGCASFTNPVLKGIPASRIPPELMAKPKTGERTIPLTWLRQKPPDVYRLAPRDVLGVWIEGILGERNQNPPIHIPEKTDAPVGMGYPIPVRSDGTISLPLIPPLRVEGMTIAEAEEAVRQAYTVKQRILKAGQERLIVTLLRPRQYRVLVIREDSGGSGGNVTVSPIGPFQPLVGVTEVSNNSRRGTGHVVDLPAYENDVLTALAKTGGLPGLDAVNEVTIERGAGREAQDMAMLCTDDSFAGTGQIVRIPLRGRPCELMPPPAQDIVLHNGDIIFVRARHAELFYAAGLLPPGEYPVPRDRDLDVVQAIAQIRGPLVNGGIAGNSLSGTIVGSGIGNPSPSLLTVLRQTPSGQVSIRVDLNVAMQDPRERILVKAGDILVLQETPAEATARYFFSTFNFFLSGRFLDTKDVQGIGTINAGGTGGTTGGQ